MSIPKNMIKLANKKTEPRAYLMELPIPGNLDMSEFELTTPVALEEALTALLLEPSGSPQMELSTTEQLSE